MELAQQLSLELVREEEPAPELDLTQEGALLTAEEEGGDGEESVAGPKDVEKLRSGLEDLFNLF